MENLESLTVGQKNALASVLYTQKFSRGQVIVSEGDPGSSYYIIKEVFHLLKNVFFIQINFREVLLS